MSDEGELHKVMMLVNAGCDTGKLTPAGQSGWERATQFSQRAPTPQCTGTHAVTSGEDGTHALLTQALLSQLELVEQGAPMPSLPEAISLVPISIVEALLEVP